MPEPLDGITVIEMTTAVQGPAAGLYLRDMGAEVIKVEPPRGDPSRNVRGRQNETPDGTMGPQYVACNRGKRSICMDLKTTEGNRAMMALMETADIFLTNYREPALRRLGLSYEELHQLYPSLIYASVNGFGPRGEDKDKAMLDGVAASRSGLIHHTGYADIQPVLPGACVMDTAGAMQLALGVLTALFAREQYGVGQRVQTSALGSALWLQQWELTHVAMTGANLCRDGNHHPNIGGFYGVYRTKDHGCIMLAQVMDKEAWDSLCIFGGRKDLSWDPRFQTPGQRIGNGLSDEDSREIRKILSESFTKKTTDEWVEFLYSQPKIIWERVRSWSEALEDEQNIANNYVTDIRVNGVGETKTVGNLVILSETPGGVKGDPPDLGEANEELLTNLGFDDADRAVIARQALKARELFLAELKALTEVGEQTSKDN